MRRALLCLRWPAALLALMSSAAAVHSAGAAHGGTTLDPADCAPGIVLTPDRLGVTYTSGHVQAGRSGRAIQPGAGFFYFEGRRLVGNEGFGFGLATASASLFAYGGSDGQSFGADISGGMWYAGAFVGSFPFAPNATYGIALDYRGAHPIAYVIAREVVDGPARVFEKVVLSEITDPLHILVYGTPTTSGVQQTIDPGNDLASAGFALDPRAALDAAYYRGAEGLVLGWNPPPILRATLAAQVHVLGSSVTAHASAIAAPRLRAADGGELARSITWSESRGSATGRGQTFRFTPERLGTYELTARLVDEHGAEATARTSLTVIRSSAIDSDGDGLSYAEESAAGSDPAVADSDHDGLRDDDERAAATDPRAPDSDGDGMTDGWEVRRGLAPMVDDAGADPDADAFPNLAEFLARTDPHSQLSYPGRGTVRLSASDRHPSVQLSADGLGASFTASGSHGVRSDAAVAPGSGWYYFEGRRECAPGNFGFGLASASAPLDAPGGANDQSFGVLATGAVLYGGAWLGNFDDPGLVEEYGFALDYSGARPKVHLVVARAGAAAVVSPAITLTGITTPVHILVFGEPVAAGVQQTINAGADAVGRPFRHPAAYLAYAAGYPGAEFMGSGFGPGHAFAGHAEIEPVDPIVLVREPGTNAGLVLAADGLGASYDAPQKSAVRANQAMRGEFRYFETRRHVGPVNIGQGLINPFADLDPYCCVSFDPRNAPPSMSLNSTGSIWQNLVWQANFPRENEYYGFAVDYRGTRPRVHCIVGGLLVATLTLSDFITPIVPMLYGDPAGPVLVNSVNFGTRPFEYDPEAALAGAGVDPAGLVRGWGAVNRPSAQPNVRARVTLSAPARAPLGLPLTVSALASDVDQADISGFIEWSADDGARGQGASFVWTPASTGVQRLSASVTDSLGMSTTASVDVRVERLRPR